MREDWVECLFGELLDIQGGSQPPKKTFIYEPREGYIRLLQIQDFGNKPHPTYIPIEKARKTCKKEDIFIARYGASLGRILRGMEGAYNVALAKIIRKLDVFDDDFLFFLLQTQIFQQPIHMISRSAQNGFAKSDLNSIKIPVPPLLEQKAIVRKIEALFSSLDSGIADLKKAQEQLVIYRQAVLKKAFEGLKEVLFEEIVTSSQNGISKRNGSEGSEIKVLRLADITTLEIDNSTPRTIKLNEKELDKYRLKEGDLVIIRVNGSINLVGRLIYVNKINEEEVWAFCDHFIRFTLNKDLCMPKFYYYFFQLQKIRKFINHNMVSSAGQNTVSQGTIKSISVPLTSIEEQHQIVQAIESRLSVCDKVEESIKESLEKAQALRQSILKKAFEGTLLSNEEIAKCKADKDYEPASVLLEKIKKEKK